MKTITFFKPPVQRETKAKRYKKVTDTEQDLDS